MAVTTTAVADDITVAAHTVTLGARMVTRTTVAVTTTITVAVAVTTTITVAARTGAMGARINTGLGQGVRHRYIVGRASRPRT